MICKHKEARFSRLVVRKAKGPRIGEAAGEAVPLGFNIMDSQEVSLDYFKYNKITELLF